MTEATRDVAVDPRTTVVARPLAAIAKPIVPRAALRASGGKVR